AVLRLTASSNFVGLSTGKSLAFSPFSDLSTKYAARRNISGRFGPKPSRPPTFGKNASPTVGRRLLRAAAATIEAFATNIPSSAVSTAPQPVLTISANAPLKSATDRTSIGENSIFKDRAALSIASSSNLASGFPGFVKNATRLNDGTTSAR